MKKDSLLKMNLQFFAEGDNDPDSVNNPEAADPDATDTEGYDDPGDEEDGSGAEPAEPQPVDVNAIAAAARREAEANARRQMEAIDADFARRFGNFTNPVTGQPIRSRADYLAALDAQEKLQAEQQLKNSGIDPAVLDSLIQNNPVIREAQQVIQQSRQQETTNAILADVAELAQMDSSIRTLADVPQEVIEKCMSLPGLRLTDAYRLVNYGKVSASKEAAINQAAINQVKGKQHMAPMDGVSTPDGQVDIPQNLVGMWKDMFPDKSMKEIKELYNKAL
jgi:hypothetical protein